MRSRIVDHRALWHDTGRVDRLVAPIIMLLDMAHVDRLSDARPLIQFQRVVPKIRIIAQAPFVALETSAPPCPTPRSSSLRIAAESADFRAFL